MNLEAPLNKHEEELLMDYSDDEYPEINPDDELYTKGVPISSIPDLYEDMMIWEPQYDI